ncbi:hypothetical protein L7F22_009747 [Adiantum nelumboides]|nr:hypothetical protein [Adiantum nelumboides]
MTVVAVTASVLLWAGAGVAALHGTLTGLGRVTSLTDLVGAATVTPSPVGPAVTGVAGAVIGDSRAARIGGPAAAPRRRHRHPRGPRLRAQHRLHRRRAGPAARRGRPEPGLRRGGRRNRAARAAAARGRHRRPPGRAAQAGPEPAVGGRRGRPERPGLVGLPAVLLRPRHLRRPALRRRVRVPPRRAKLDLLAERNRRLNDVLADGAARFGFGTAAPALAPLCDPDRDRMPPDIMGLATPDPFQPDGGRLAADRGVGGDGPGRPAPRRDAVTPLPGRSGVGVAQHPQRVAVGQLRQVLRAPSAVGERVEQPRVGGHVGELVGQLGGAVVVPADADVVDARGLAQVLDVRHDVGEGGARLNGPVPGLDEPVAGGEVAVVGAGGGHRLPQPLVPLGHGGGDEARHERRHGHAAVAGQRLQHVGGHVARVVGDGAGAGVGEQHRPGGDGEGLVHRRRSDVREVDDHADAVHLGDDPRAELRQPVVAGRVGGRVGPVVVQVVGQRQVADPEPAQHPQHGEGVGDAVPALRPHQGGDPPGADDGVDVVGGVGERQGVRVGGEEPPHPVHLVEHRGDGLVVAQLAGYVDRPELGADPAGPQPREVGVQPRVPGGDVRLARRVAAGELAQRPGQRVGGGDQLVELQRARPVQVELAQDVPVRVGLAEHRALDALLEQGDVGQRHRQRLGGVDVTERGDDDGARLADRGHGLPDVLGLDDADGDDRLVGTLAVGELLGQLGGLLHRLDAVGGAELLGLLTLERDRVDGDDVGRARVGRPLHRVDADAADAHDDRGVAGLDLARVDRGAPAGADAAADEAGHVERDVVRDLDAGAGGGLLPAGAGEQARAEVAEVLHAGRAPAAVAAGGQEGEDDVVALLEPLVVAPGLGDDAGALVATGERVDADRDVAGGDVVVGVAQARRGHLDLDLAGARLVEFEVDDLVLARSAPDDCSTGVSHGGSPQTSSSNRMRTRRYEPGHSREVPHADRGTPFAYVGVAPPAPDRADRRVGDLLGRRRQRGGFHPLGHPPDHETGPDQQQPHPGPVQRVGQAGGEPVEPGLRRAVDVVGAPHPHAGHRGVDHQRPAPLRAQHLGQLGEDVHLRDVVGVHDGGRVRGVGLGAGLVAENAERDDDGVDPAVPGRDVVDQRAVAARSSASKATVSTVAPAARTRAASAVSAPGRRAASTTVSVSPAASRSATSSPISLRPPRTRTVRSEPPTRCSLPPGGGRSSPWGRTGKPVRCTIRCSTRSAPPRWSGCAASCPRGRRRSGSRPSGPTRAAR